MELTPVPRASSSGRPRHQGSHRPKNRELGYDQPFLVRYVRYIWDAARGNLGTSWSSGRPVLAEIMTASHYAHPGYRRR